MKKKVLFVIILLILTAQNCFGYWIWSPKTGKWINPTYKVFDTPQEQFEWAKRYFDENDYKKAVFEFKKVLNKFPKTEYAPEAKYYIGICEEKRGKHYKAFLTYQSVIEIYPLNDRLEEIVERQYLIGEIFFGRKNYERAQEIFEKSILNSPYSKVSDVAQYKIGLCLLRMRQFDEARDEFNKVLDAYSFSLNIDDASFNAAICSFKLSSLIKDYDVELLDRAQEDLSSFLRRFPTSEYVPQAESLLNKIISKKAEKLYRTACFYEKQHKTYAAMKYYEELMYFYEQTGWAQQAKPKLDRLRNK
ncbi:MAG: tetratricopeptide repeat protein [Candidatus Omnitrophota bacterium]